MGSSEDKQSKRGKHSKLIFIFLLMVITDFPARGFFLKSCTLDSNIAACVKKKLRTVPQDIPPTITGFDLSVNKLSRIQASDFKHLPFLLRLDLNRNYISQIGSFSFARLISLQKLNLNSNRVVQLEENVFDGLGNLTELMMTHNRIKVVAPTSFQSLTRLKRLDLSFNKFQNMSYVHLILQHLPQLKELLLKGNALTSFQSGELPNCWGQLNALDLSFNPLNDFTITEDAFPNLTRFIIGNPYSKTQMKWDVRSPTFLRRVSKLNISGLHMALDDMKALFESVNSSLTGLYMSKMRVNIGALVNISCTIPTMSTLHVSQNKLKSISQYFLKLCANVTELDLSENKIEIIQADAFTPLENLQILDLSRNRLPSVPSAMKNLRNLSKLDLSFNNISTFECGDFSNQTKLRQLNLKNNLFPALKTCAFKDLVQLNGLKLQSCHIRNLNGAFERHLPNLQWLQLNGNKLTTIKNGELRGLRSLLSLSLHENKIRNLKHQSFVGLTNLSSIKLQSNWITNQDLNTGAFNTLINLRTLDLSDNHIKFVSQTSESQTPFSNLLHLEKLSVNTQHLKGKSRLPPHFLKGLTSLLSFSTRNIQLISLDKDVFKYTPNLEKLDVSSNDLGNLPAELFSPIPNLKTLKISRASLQSLDFLIKANLTKVDFLQSTHNQFSVITEDVIKSLPALSSVNLDGNSFMCDCDNAWFLNWTKASKQTQVLEASNFLCNYPEGFQGTKFLDFDPTSCSVEIGFICYMSTTCMILCFMVASFTYHFMRWQLYCAYYLFLAWLYDKQYEKKQTPHEYDAFISYNTHDEPWVFGELLPKLEGEQGWRLCLHHRDFEPGKPIIDNISDAIYGSRKTICVISHRYLESEWCSREVQTASFRLFDEQKDVLILVFLEDIPTHLLSPYHRMRKLLKKQTYLSWPRAADHPEVFWEKLRQALQARDDLNKEKQNLGILEPQAD